MDVPVLIRAFGALFAVMNPFVVLPMYLALTHNQDAAQLRRTSVRVVLYSLSMAAVVMVSGSAILGFFGISVDHFRVAGGIVLGMIGLGMLNGGSSAHEGTPQQKASMRSRAQHPARPARPTTRGPRGLRRTPASAPPTRPRPRRPMCRSTR